MKLSIEDRALKVPLAVQMVRAKQGLPGVIGNLEGPPSTGKSSKIAQIRKANGWGGHSMVLSRYDAVEVTGMTVPDLQRRILDHLFPRSMFLDAKNFDYFLVNLEELQDGARDVQSALQDMGTSRTAEGEPLPDSVIWSITGNDAKSGTNSRPLSRPWMERSCKIKAGVDKEAFLSWARSDAEDLDAWIIHPKPIPFKVDPRLLAVVDFDSSILDSSTWKHGPNDPPNAAPRTLTNLSDLMSQAWEDDPEVMDVLGPGTVGNQWARIRAFMDLVSKIPKYRDIIGDPRGAAVPDNLEQAFAVMGNMSYELSFKTENKVHLHPDEVKAIFTYLERFNRAEIKVCAVNLLRASHKDVVNSKSYGDYCIANQDIL